MARKKPKTIPYRRKREGKTNYRKRLRFLLAKSPRLVVRFTNQKIILQLITFKPEGDFVLFSLDSTILRKYFWDFSLKNMPAAYLIGYLFGKKALQKEIKKAVLDIGFRSSIKGNKIYACLKGVREAGLEVAYSEDVFPSWERISGKHIEKYAQQIKENPSLYQRRFSQYLKKNLEPSQISKSFQRVKEKIEQEENLPLKQK